MSAPNRVTLNAASEHELIALLGAAFPLTGKMTTSMPEIRDWQAVAASAQSNGLTGMLVRAIEILKRNDVPGDVESGLRDVYRRNALAQSLAYRELEGLLQEVAANKIPLVLLKGAALAKTLYPESALRPFGDLDVLVQRANATRVREMLLGRGLAEAKVTYGFNTDFYGEMAFFPSRTQDYMIDLHWELVAPAYYRKRMDLDWFWKRTEQLKIGAQHVLVFQPTAQLVHSAVHVGLHHQDHVRLIWLYDLALLIARRGQEIDWQEADSFARGAGLTRPLRAMLDMTRAKWGITLPEETETLFRPSPFALGERMVYAISTTRFPEAVMLSDALAAPGMGSKVRFVQQHLFPEAAYMRTRYSITNDALMPLYYAWRVAESGFKFVRSLWTAITRK